jgi:membrane-associated phospholipid phosphatase
MSFSAVLDQSPHGLTEATMAFAHRLQRLPSLLVFLLVGSVGAFVLSASMISLGLFTSRTLLSVSQIGAADARVPSWLASHPTPFLMDAAYVGYMLADAWVLAPLVTAASTVLALARRWRRAAFLILAALVEIWGYTLTSAFVHWQTTSEAGSRSFPWISFPAGRVAAAIAIYGAVAFLLTAEVRNGWARSVFWASGLAVSLAVAASAMYRGDHHLVDIAGGAVMGMGALLVALLAEQVAGIVAELRREKLGRAVL